MLARIKRKRLTCNHSLGAEQPNLLQGRFSNAQQLLR
jgi:hypothetical protein